MKEKTKKHELVIRPMRRADAPEMLDMMRGLQAFHGDKTMTTATDFATYCCGPRRLSRAWIATVDGTPVGFAIIKEWINLVRAKPTRTLDLLYVNEAFRGRGVGMALLATIAKDGLEKGFLRLDTSAALNNRGANAFYKALGFEAIKHKSRRYGMDGPAFKKLAEQKNK